MAKIKIGCFGHIWGIVWALDPLVIFLILDALGIFGGLDALGIGCFGYAPVV
jgi:hypothetical protein